MTDRPMISFSRRWRVGVSTIFSGFISGKDAETRVTAGRVSEGREKRQRPRTTEHVYYPTGSGRNGGIGGIEAEAGTTVAISFEGVKAAGKRGGEGVHLSGYRCRLLC